MFSSILVINKIQNTVPFGLLVQYSLIYCPFHFSFNKLFLLLMDLGIFKVTVDNQSRNFRKIYLDLTCAMSRNLPLSFFLSLSLSLSPRIILLTFQNYSIAFNYNILYLNVSRIFPSFNLSLFTVLAMEKKFQQYVIHHSYLTRSICDI